MAIFTIPVFADDIVRDAALAAARTTVLSNPNLTPAEKSSALAQIDTDEITQAQAEAGRIIVAADSLRAAGIDPGAAATEAALEAILTAAALAAIKAEIQNDPSARGYSGKTAQQQADLLNTPVLSGGDARTILSQVCFPNPVPVAANLTTLLNNASVGADVKTYLQRNNGTYFKIHGQAGGGSAGDAAVLTALGGPISAGTPGDARMSVILRGANGAPFPFMPNAITAAHVTAALAS